MRKRVDVSDERFLGALERETEMVAAAARDLAEGLALAPVEERDRKILSDQAMLAANLLREMLGHREIVQANPLKTASPLAGSMPRRVWARAFKKEL